jgi:hypothetical protein
MINLPEIPARIANLHKDSRGYPVPWFVAWLKGGEPCPPGRGEPDFRIIGPGKLTQAYNESRCWICGRSLIGSSRIFVIGPMCVINRVTSEPPNHRECAEFAAKACPFLTNPRQKRDYKDMIEHPVTAFSSRGWCVISSGKTHSYRLVRERPQSNPSRNRGIHRHWITFVDG